MAGLEFEGLTAETFGKFREQMLHSEEAYPEPIRSTTDDFIDMLKQEKTIALVALLDSQYIGNIIGCELCGEDLAECDPHIIPGKKTIYIYNFVIEREYQHKGYAKVMFNEFIGKARSMGFEMIAGHFRNNCSLPVFKKFGGVEKSVFTNWENTGEDYILCELDIAIKVPVESPVQQEPAAPAIAPVLPVPAVEPSLHIEPQDMMPPEMDHELHSLPSV
jgi:GNAT superfamily N-acetyltransferase